MALLTKRVRAGTGFVWVLALSRVPGKWIVADAFRLYGSPEQIDRWASEPLEAFAEVLDRYGLDFAAGAGNQNRPVRFAPFVRVPAPSGQLDPSVLISALGIEPGKSFHMSQMIRITPEGEAQMAFAYFVDSKAYAADAKSAGGSR